MKPSKVERDAELKPGPGLIARCPKCNLAFSGPSRKERDKGQDKDKVVERGWAPIVFALNAHVQDCFGAAS